MTHPLSDSFPLFSIIPTSSNLSLLEQVVLDMGLLLKKRGASYDVKEQELDKLQTAVLEASYVLSPLKLAVLPPGVDKFQFWIVVFRPERPMIPCVLHPTAKENLLFYSIARVLNTRLDSAFSNNSFGFRKSYIGVYTKSKEFWSRRNVIKGKLDAQYSYSQSKPSRLFSK